MAHSNSWSRTENGNVLFISEFTQMKWVQAQIRSATGVVVVAFRNYCIWYAMNGIVIFISILVSLNQLIRLRTGITITPCSTLHTIVSLMRFVVKHLFLLFSFSCLINFMFLYFFHFQSRNLRWVSMKNKLRKQNAASINGSNQCIIQHIALMQIQTCRDLFNVHVFLIR